MINSVARAAALFCSIVLVSAVPNVTVVPVGGGSCDWFPNSQRGNFGGPFQFHIRQPDDQGIEGLVSTSRSYGNWNGSEITTLVMNLRRSYYFPHPMYRCDGGNVYDWSGPERSAIYISKEQQDLGQMLYAKDGLKIQTFRHQIGEVTQPGVYIGTENRTTWAFRYFQPNECSRDDFYFARLLGKGEGVEVGEIAGFLEATRPGVY